MPFAVIRSTAVVAAASGSLTASARPRIVARTKSCAAVGCSAANSAEVKMTPNEPGTPKSSGSNSWIPTPARSSCADLVALPTRKTDDGVDLDVGQRVESVEQHRVEVVALDESCAAQHHVDRRRELALHADGGAGESDSSLASPDLMIKRVDRAAAFDGRGDERASLAALNATISLNDPPDANCAVPEATCG